jgi:hypothetical protein
MNEVYKVAKAKYTVILHDDDLLHPQYFETVLKVLNKYKNVNLITTSYTEFIEKYPVLNKPLEGRVYLFKSQKDFARYMFFAEKINYASAVYKTENFLKVRPDIEQHGKFYDWPFIINTAARGNIVHLKDDNIFYTRIHPGQHTNAATYLSVKHIINWDKTLVDAMKLSSNTLAVNCAYAQKMYYFILGKYDAFLSPYDKEKYSKYDILALASQKLPFKLADKTKALPSFLTKFLRKYALRKIRRKGRKRLYD